MNSNIVFGINAVREAIKDVSRIQKVLIDKRSKTKDAKNLKDEIIDSEFHTLSFLLKNSKNLQKKIIKDLLLF